MRAVALVAIAACGPSRAAEEVAHAPAPVRCPEVTAAVSLASQDEVAALASCTRVGGLAVRTAAPIDLATLEVEGVSGDLVIGPTVALEAIHLDRLRGVGGELRIISNTALHGVYLPALERVGRVVIEGNLGLTTIAAPKLATAGEGVSLRDNHDLSFVDLGGLATVKTMQIEGSPELPEDVITDLRARAQPPPDAPPNAR